MNDDLRKKINVLLDEELRYYSVNGRKSGGLGSMNITLQSMPNNGWTREGEIPNLLFDESNEDIILSPNAIILMQIYDSLDITKQNDFKEYLISLLNKNSEYSKVGYFVFFVLYRIGFGLEALEYAQKNLFGDSNLGYSNLLGAFSMIVSREYLSISPDEYEKIKKILEIDTEYNFQLKEKINLALLKHIEKGSGINQKSSHIKKNLSKFGFQNDQLLDEKIKAANDFGGPISLLFLDLDNFKSVNDTYDHETGDKIILESLNIVQGTTKGKGEVFHRSGDEIMVLLVNSNEGEAFSVAERIRQNIEKYNFPTIGPGVVTATIGLSCYPDNCPNIENLKIEADQAAMQMKKLGKNRIGKKE